MLVSFTPFLHTKTETYVRQQIIDFLGMSYSKSDLAQLSSSWRAIICCSALHLNIPTFITSPKLCKYGHMLYFLLDFLKCYILLITSHISLLKPFACAPEDATLFLHCSKLQHFVTIFFFFFFNEIGESGFGSSLIHWYVCWAQRYSKSPNSRLWLVLVQDFITKSISFIYLTALTINHSISLNNIV